MRFAGVNGAENLIFHVVRRVALNKVEDEEKRVDFSLLFPSNVYYYCIETEYK